MRNRLFWVVGLVLLVCGTFVGQTFTGSISGIVTDSSGALMGGVPVIITDLDKNTTYRTVSNQTGFYVVSSLAPANYLVQAEKPGFHRFSLSGLPLSTQQKATVDIQLQVGALAESVTVTAGAQLLEASTATLSAVVENKRIVDLPLNGRNILQLASLVPGVFTARQLSGTDSSTGVRYYVNGGQEGTGDILLDGVSMMVPGVNSGLTSVSASPSVDSIQEFRIQTNGYSAEYGHSGAGMITLVTKSGTNKFHGSAYEFLRNSKMDSNNFFANRSGLPLTSFKRNQFGGSISGPVALPKVYNGHNRTFFFADFEGQRVRSPDFVQQTVPTALEKLGDFSEWRNTNGTLRLIYDPFSTRPDPTLSANSGIRIRDPLPGNKVPLGKIDPVALAAQKYYPDPNQAGRPFTHQNNYIAQGPAAQRQDRFETKIDHVFNERQRLFGRFSVMNIRNATSNYWNNVANPSNPPSISHFRNLALDYTHTLSNVSLLNIRFGGGMGWSDSTPWSLGFRPTSLGLPAGIESFADMLLFPPMQIQDYTAAGPGSNYGKTHSYSPSLIANLSRVSGRHSLKTGIDFRFQYVNSTSTQYPDGRYNFTTEWTQGPRADIVSNTGAGYASFLFGTLNTAQLGKEPDIANGSHYFGSFIQDDFKVSSKLTLNVGLRWDIDTGETERFNRIAAIDLYVKSPLADKVGLPLKGGYLFAGENESLGRRAVRPADFKKLNPRFGIAYQLGPRTTIRTAYGVFFAQSDFSAGKNYTGQTFRTTTFATPAFENGLPRETLRNVYSTFGYNVPVGAAQGLLSQYGVGPLDSGYPDALLSNYNQSWNFTIQRSLGNNLVLEAAYAGNKGTHTAQNMKFGQLDPQYLVLGDKLKEIVPNPMFGIIPSQNPTTTRGNLLLPYPQFTTVQTANAGWGNSNYHALQTRLEKRYSAGLSLMASYTWSKTMTDIADAAPSLNVINTDIRNFYCRACEHGLSTYDQPHRFVLNGTYELPLGRHKALGGGWNKLVDAMFGQWQVNGILTLSKGLPLRFTVAQKTINAGPGAGQKPDASGINPDLGSKRTIDRWFDTAQILNPKPYTFGTLARTDPRLRGDGATNLDASLFKNFRIGERAQLQFRAEAFNATNTPLFAPPATTLGGANFGVVTAQENSPRQMQMALKILF